MSTDHFSHPSQCSAWYWPWQSPACFHSWRSILQAVLLPSRVGLGEQGWDCIPLRMGKVKGGHDATSWGYHSWIVWPDPSIWCSREESGFWSQEPWVGSYLRYSSVFCITSNKLLNSSKFNVFLCRMGMVTRVPPSWAQQLSSSLVFFVLLKINEEPPPSPYTITFVFLS